MLFALNSESGSSVVVNEALTAVEQQGVFISSQQEYLHKYFVQVDFSKLVGKSLHWTSNGRWGFHDLIVFLLRITGPAHVQVCSFTISVAAANAFVKAQDSGFFLSCSIVVNSGKRNDQRKALEVLGNRFDVRFAPVHAKICVIRNERFAFSVLSSGNLSSGGNKERGVVFTDPEIIEFDGRFISSLSE